MAASTPSPSTRRRDDSGSIGGGRRHNRPSTRTAPAGGRGGKQRGPRVFFWLVMLPAESGRCTYRSSDGSLSAYQSMQKNDDDGCEVPRRGRVKKNKKKTATRIEPIGEPENRWKIGGSYDSRKKNRERKKNPRKEVPR